MIPAFKFLSIGLLISLSISSDLLAQEDAMGAIAGKIDRAYSVKAVIAVNRADGSKFPGAYEHDSGTFTIRGLPVPATYDCIIDFENARLEGVNLNVPVSDYVEEQSLSEEDIETITTKVRRMNTFEDVVEVKTIQGNIQHAAILLNKVRTKPFFGSKPGEVIWRVELWRFERPEETWVKVQDELFTTLYRERIQEGEYNKKSLTLDPKLGGVTLTTESTQIDLGVVEPPIEEKGIHFRSRAEVVTE